MGWQNLKMEIMYNYVTRKSLYAFTFKKCKHIHTYMYTHKYKSRLDSPLFIILHLV